MKEDFQLGWRPVKNLAQTSNTPRSLILRQKYAEMMISLYEAGHRIINVDETWVNDLNYCRRVWRLKGANQTLKKIPVYPNLSMILAIDTFGNSYFSLSHARTDSETFCEFIHFLCERLNEKEVGWK